MNNHILTFLLALCALSSSGLPLNSVLPSNSSDGTSKKNLTLNNNATTSEHNNLLSDLARISEEAVASKDERNKSSNQTILNSKLHNVNNSTSNVSLDLRNTTGDQGNKSLVQSMAVSENASTRTTISNTDAAAGAELPQNAALNTKLSEPTHLTFDDSEADEEKFSKLVTSNENPMKDDEGITTKKTAISPLLSDSKVLKPTKLAPGDTNSEIKNSISSPIASNNGGQTANISQNKIMVPKLNENAGTTNEPTFVDQASEKDFLQKNYKKGEDKSLSDAVTVCSGEEKTISCPSQFSLLIDSASYGYNANGRCGGASVMSPTCQASGIRKVIESACQGQSSCLLQSNGREFRGECPGTNNYLKVGYTCQYKRSSTAAQPAVAARQPATAVQPPTVAQSPAMAAQPSAIAVQPTATVTQQQPLTAAQPPVSSMTAQPAKSNTPSSYASSVQTSPYIPHPVPQLQQQQQQQQQPSSDSYYNNYYKTNQYGGYYQDHNNNLNKPNNLYNNYYNNKNNQGYYNSYYPQNRQPVQPSSQRYNNKYKSYLKTSKPRLPSPPSHLPTTPLRPPLVPPLAPSRNLVAPSSRLYQNYQRASPYRSYSQPGYQQNSLAYNYNNQAQGGYYGRGYYDRGYYGRGYYSAYPTIQLQRSREYAPRNSYTASCYACQDCKQCSSKAYCGGCPSCKALTCKKKTAHKKKYKDPIDMLVEEFGRKTAGMNPMEMSAVVLSPVPPATPLIAKLSPAKPHPKALEEDNDSDEDEFEDFSSPEIEPQESDERYLYSDYGSENAAQRSHVNHVNVGREKKRKHHKKHKTHHIKHWNPMNLFKSANEDVEHQQSRRNINYSELSNYDNQDDDIEQQERRKLSKRWNEEDDVQNDLREEQLFINSDLNEIENGYNAQIFY